MSEQTSNIIPINIEDEMRGAYIDYSMSVIVSRALPDVRDGLKPVHRRVLFGMDELGVNYNKSYKKSVNYLNYERIPLNAILLKIVNGKTITNAKRDTLAEPRKTRIAFFLQAGANAYHYKSKQSSFLTNFSESGINYSPVLGAGVDIVPNKFRSWYFVRMEINYTSSKYESKRSQTVLDNIFQYSSSINESILTFLPSFNWFIHQSTNSKIFLGVGISYSYSPSVKNFSTTKIYNLSGVQVGENSSYVKNSASWLGLNIMPGVILNDKLHITGGLIIGRVGNEKFSSLTAETSVHLKFCYYFYSR